MSVAESHHETLLRLAVADRRPLYLDPKAPTQVDIVGPALSIRVQGQAERLMPLRRISRILVNERTGLSTAALLGCADRGISILFVDIEGEVRGRLLGAPGERQELRQRLVDLLDRPDWKDLYGNWLYAQERRAVLRVQRRMRIELQSASPISTGRWISEQAVRLAGPKDAARSQRWMEEQLFAWMLHHLQTLGLGGQSELGQDGRPDLVADLSAVLRWYGEPIRVGWLRRRADWAQRRSCVPSEIARHDLVSPLPAPRFEACPFRARAHQQAAPLAGGPGLRDRRMADLAPRLHIVCYDIADPRRLAKVHRCLVKRAVPLQYSVFLLFVAKDGLVEILGEIERLIDRRADDVRAYPLPSRLEYLHLGRQLFPDGIALVDPAFPPQLFESAA